MLHSVPQNLTREFCYFLKITNKQQNRHAKLIVQVVMQSMDEAGNISWSSLISVTSSFPARGETTWDLFYFMGEGLKRNPPKQAQLLSVYICPVFPIFFVDLTEIQLLPPAPALRHHCCDTDLPARSQNTHSEQLSSDGRSIATNFLTS